MAANNVPVHREPHDVEIAAMYTFYKRSSNSLYTTQPPNPTKLKYNKTSTVNNSLRYNVRFLKLQNILIMSTSMGQQKEVTKLSSSCSLGCHTLQPCPLARQMQYKQELLPPLVQQTPPNSRTTHSYIFLEQGKVPIFTKSQDPMQPTTNVQVASFENLREIKSIRK